MMGVDYAPSNMGAKKAARTSGRLGEV